MDHSIVVMMIQFNPANRGPGYLKLNNNFLLDKDYVEKMNSLIDIELDQNYLNAKQKWEMVKLSVWGSTLQFSSRKKKSDINKI